MTRRDRNALVTLSLLLCLAAVVLWARSKRERSVQLTPGVWVYLALGGGSRPPSVIDARHTPKGLDPGGGGSHLVQDVTALEVVNGKYVVGKTHSGEFFVVDLRELGRDELAEDTVQRFPSEAEWQAACRSRGFDPPKLREPDDF